MTIRLRQSPHGESQDHPHHLFVVSDRRPAMMIELQTDTHPVKTIDARSYEDNTEY